MMLFAAGCCSRPRRPSTRLSIRSIKRFSSTMTWRSILSTVKPPCATAASLRSGSRSLPTWWHWRFFRDDGAGLQQRHDRQHECTRGRGLETASHVARDQSLYYPHIRAAARKRVCGSGSEGRNDMSRVRLVGMATALIAVGFATAALAQQQQRPQIETTKVDGTDNVYIFRNGNHQSMFIVTRDGVIATDPIAYGRPTGGQDYIAEIKKGSPTSPSSSWFTAITISTISPAASRSRTRAPPSSRTGGPRSAWRCSRIRIRRFPIRWSAATAGPSSSAAPRWS